MGTGSPREIVARSVSHLPECYEMWVLTCWTVMSREAGTEQRMIGLQRSSRHYLQRPDATHLGVDSSATALSGYGGRLALNKQEGNVRFNTALGVMNPTFDVNDVGYQSRSDVVTMHLSSGYRFARPNAWCRDGTIRSVLFESFDFGGDRVGAAAGTPAPGRTRGSGPTSELGSRIVGDGGGRRDGGRERVAGSADGGSALRRTICPWNRASGLV